MWNQEYELRLRDWYCLRAKASDQSTKSALLIINDWWWQAPIIQCSLRWSDQGHWPDPWCLLQQSGFCDLARALGMLYTVSMLERREIDSMVLAETPDNVLVLVNSAKYIMNWSPGVIVNTLAPAVVIQQTIDAGELTKSIR